MSNKAKQTPLVQSILVLQEHLNDFERLGAKINSEDLSDDFDVDYMRKLLIRFAECGQEIAKDMASFSTQLEEARSGAESIAASVSRQTQTFKKRTDEQNENLEKFRALGERVRELNAAITGFSPAAEGADSQVKILEPQLAAIVEELQELRASARSARMKSLEKQAESLSQSLQALQTKLRNSPQISQ